MCAQGALPGHVVAVTTLLASESIKLGGRELKVKRPGALSSPGRFLFCAARDCLRSHAERQREIVVFPHYGGLRHDNAPGPGHANEQATRGLCVGLCPVARPSPNTLRRITYSYCLTGGSGRGHEQGPVMHFPRLCEAYPGLVSATCGALPFPLSLALSSDGQSETCNGGTTSMRTP